MKLKNVLLISLPLLILLFIYLGGAMYYSDVFLPNTYLNNTNVGGKKVIEVKNKIQEDATKESIVITKNDNSTEEIKLSDIDYTCEYETDIEDIKKSQSSFKWIFSLFGEENYSIKLKTSYNEEKLNKAVESLKCVTNEAIQDPVDAHVEKTDTGFIVVDAIDGNRLDEEKLKSVIKENFDKGNYNINLSEEGCYLMAKVRADDPSITELMNLVNKFNEVSVTIDLTDATEIVDFSVFKDWLIVEDGEVSLDDEALKQYVTNLSVKYNTYGTTRKFNATGIGEIEVGVPKNDTYGFQLDISKTQELLKEAIITAETKTIKPEWKIPAKCRGELNDIGDTYIEADLTRQYLWYYVKGELVLECDFVSGLDTEKRKTPTGVFRVWHKEKDRYLTGQGYRSHVDYWMPFDWTGCGLHDAGWRGSFGGNIYKTNGSHGCLNLPPSTASRLYELVEYDTPVIVYNS